MYVGLDVHKNWTTVVGVEPETGEIRRLDRVANEREAFEEALCEWNGPLHGVMEAGRATWAVHDKVEPLFERLVVGDATEMKRRMSGGGAKTDRRDALRMALLLAQDRVPALWVPDRQTRELRVRTRGKARLAQLISQVACQVRAVGAITALRDTRKPSTRRPELAGHLRG